MSWERLGAPSERNLPKLLVKVCRSRGSNIFALSDASQNIENIAKFFWERIGSFWNGIRSIQGVSWHCPGGYCERVRSLGSILEVLGSVLERLRIEIGRKHCCCGWRLEVGGRCDALEKESSKKQGNP
jgi:hypothetical protein